MFKLRESLTLALLLVICGSVQAGDTAQAGAEQQPTAAERLQLQAMSLQKKLADIQQRALAANPELEQQRLALEKLVLQTLENQGVSPKEDTERLKMLQQQANEPGLEEAERREIASEFESIRQRLQKAQQGVMQSESVQQAQQEFRNDLLLAMRAENDQTMQWIEELQQAITQLQQEQAAP